MADVTTEISNYLATNGHGTVDTDIFRGDLPDTPDLCTGLFPYGGPYSVCAFEGLLWELPHMQLLTRGRTYLQARQRIENAREILQAVVNQTISGSRYLRIILKQPPYLLERDEEKRTVLSFNMEIWRNANP